MEKFVNLNVLDNKSIYLTMHSLIYNNATEIQLLTYLKEADVEYRRHCTCNSLGILLER